MSPEKRATVASIAARQLGLVSVSQLHDAGVTRHEIAGVVRRGELERVRDEVFAAPSSPRTDERAVLAEVLAAGEHAVASHTTAAAIHGVPGYRLGASWPIHVTVPEGTRPRAALAVVHFSRALLPHHLGLARPIPVTNVARTLFDLAALGPADRVERALDNMLASQRVTVAAVERVLSDLAAPGRAGTALTRELISERSGGFVVTQSRLEARFLWIVEQWQLPAPRREVDLGSDAAWNGRVEFVFDHGVHVEVDGRRWHSALLDIEHDEDRDNEFAAVGFTPLRFRWRVLRDRPRHVADQVRTALATAARHRGDLTIFGLS